MTTNSKEKITVSIDSELKELIPGFLRGREEDIHTLNQSLETSDYATIQSIGHTMKGNGAGYGFDKISEIGRQLEIAAKKKEDTAISEHTDALRVYLREIDIIYE